MPCFRPLAAFRAPGGGISFHTKGAYVDRPMLIACGQCIGCKLERARQWAVRCMHEASMHDQNCFVTLTYKAAPPRGSLDRGAFPAFIKRLRRDLGETRIKYFHCGEYGEELARPHYHGLIFGFDFQDKTRWSTSSSGHPQFRSAHLERLWPYGFSSIGALTFETAAYTARYCTKKITGDLAPGHYGDREPEFMTCSKGIGQAWIEKYKDETYRDDSIISRGHEGKPPRYYDKYLKAIEPRAWRKVELDRLVAGNARQVRWNRTTERLLVREQVKLAELGTRPRSYEK